MTRPNLVLGILLTLLTAGLWSLAGIFIKSIDAPWITINVYRTLVAGLVLLPVALGHARRSPGGRAPAPARRPGWIALTILAFATTTSLFTWANQLTSAANAILLQYSAPVWVFVLSAIVLRVHIRPSEWVCLGVAMLGVGIILLGATAGGAGGTDLLGCLVGAVTGLTFGALLFCLRQLRDHSVVRTTCRNSLATAVLLLPGLLLWPAGDGGFGAAAVVPAPQAALLLAMGLVQLAAPYLLFSVAMRHVEAHAASLLLLIEPVLNPLWVWLRFGETPGGWTLVGGTVILSSVAMVMVDAWRHGRRQAPVIARVPADDAPA